MGRGAYRRPGKPIVRRDAWRGRPVVGWGGVVVSDTDDLLVLFDTHDLELDAIRGKGRRVTAALDAGRRWNDGWASWVPDPAWPVPRVPDGWERAA